MSEATITQLFTEMFSTRRLTADQVLIGSGGNRFVDAQFTSAVEMKQRLQYLNFTIGSGRTGWTVVPAAGGEAVGLRTVTTQAPGNTNGITSAEVFWAGPTIQPSYTSGVQVKPGDRIMFFAWVTTSENAAVTWMLRRWNGNSTTNPATTSTSSISSTVQPGLTSGKRWVRAEYTVPATGVTAIYPHLLFTNQTANPNTITVWGGAEMLPIGVESLAVFGDATYGSSPAVPYDVRATIGTRTPSGNTLTTAGMWFSFRKKDMTDVPPMTEAGLTSTGPTGTGVGAQLHSSAVNQLTDSASSRVWVDPNSAGIDTRDGVTGGPRFLLETTSSTFNMRTFTSSVEHAGIRTDGDSVLDLQGREGFVFRTGSTSIDVTKPITSNGAWTHTGPVTVTGDVSFESDVTFNSSVTKAVSYTWSKSVGNAAATNIGAMTLVGGQSNVAEGVIAVKNANGQFTIQDAGVFTFTVTSVAPAAMTGRSYLEVAGHRTSISTGEQSGSVSVTRYMTAGTVITANVFQTSAATRTMNGVVNVVRHA